MQQLIYLGPGDHEAADGTVGVSRHIPAQLGRPVPLAVCELESRIGQQRRYVSQVPRARGRNSISLWFLTAEMDNNNKDLFQPKADWTVAYQPPPPNANGNPNGLTKKQEIMVRSAIKYWVERHKHVVRYVKTCNFVDARRNCVFTSRWRTETTSKLCLFSLSAVFPIFNWFSPSAATKIFMLLISGCENSTCPPRNQRRPRSAVFEPFLRLKLSIGDFLTTISRWNDDNRTSAVRSHFSASSVHFTSFLALLSEPYQFDEQTYSPKMKKKKNCANLASRMWPSS